MDCELLEEELSAFADGELDDETRATVAEHVAGCGLCAAELDDMRCIKSMVSRIRRTEVAAPESLAIFPDEQPAAVPQTSTAFWRRPLPGKAIALAAAAVFVGLLIGWRHTAGQYGYLARANDAVVAHLSGATVALRDGGDGPNQRVGGGGGTSYLLYSGPAQVGEQPVNQAVYVMGEFIVSQFIFNAGEFDDSQMSRMSVGNRDYRVAASREFSIVTCTSGTEQSVLVAACPAEELVKLAQNIPCDGATNTGLVGY